MANLYRVQTVFTGVAGSPYYNTLYFAAGFGTATAAVTAAAGFWGTLDGQMADDITWDIPGDVEVIDDATGNIVNVENTTPQNGSGSLTAALLPPSSQGLIRWRTGTFVGGREIRGKTFVPGLTVSASTDGQVSTAMITAMENTATALVGSPTAQLVVWSKKNGQSATVVSSSAWSEFAVLRSRRD
jgi:hypothetical protein